MDSTPEVHNREADASTEDLEASIGSTLYSKQYVLDLLENEPSEEDLESLSEMACDDEVAMFLSREAKSFVLLSMLIKSNSTFRIKELAMVILTNMMRVDFASFRHEDMCISVPSALLKQNLQENSDVYYLPSLVAILQYLTMFNDKVLEDFDDENDKFEHNFELVPNVLIMIASTLDQDLLGKASRFLFSVVEVASMTSEPLDHIGMFFETQPLQCLTEGIQQSLQFQESGKTAFILVETIANVFDFLDDETVESEQSHQMCEILVKYLNVEDLEISAVTSCAKICSRLWTTTCHLPSFEKVAKMFMEYQNDDSNVDKVMLDVIQQCLKHFVNVHSQTLLSNSELLQSPTLGKFVQMLVTTQSASDNPTTTPT